MTKIAQVEFSKDRTTEAYSQQLLRETIVQGSPKRNMRTGHEELNATIVRRATKCHESRHVKTSSRQTMRLTRKDENAVISQDTNGTVRCAT